MPNAYANKIQVTRGGQTETLIDLTADTITASALMQGYTAHDASGAPITGTATGGSMVIRDEADSHGGTIRHITAGTVVTGTTSITENGSYDVSQYADAVVNVPAPAPTLQSKTATPTESEQTIAPDSGYDGLSSVSVGAISSTYVGSGIARRDSTDLTASGATVTVPSGYYAAAASKAVASGTAGTPTATKGTVSNHAVSVTPSVTNSAGYISGGTKTGTAVSVSASELVSGSETKTSNGTYDVTNLASVVVDVASSGIDVPIFTYNPNNDSFSCNKTYAECFAMVNTDLDGDYFEDAYAIITFSEGEQTFSYGLSGQPLQGGTLRYTGTRDGVPVYQIDYMPNGTIVIGTPASLVSLTATQNGTYTPTYGTVYNSVVVNVPSGGGYDTEFANTIMRSGSVTKIPSSITSIGSYAFYNCTNLALTSLPSSITTIGSYAFSRCSGLTSISSEARITSISGSAFFGASSYPMALTSARFPNMALSTNLGTVFGSSTAANACQLLESCDIGSTTGIGANAFANCYKLQTLVLRRTASVCTLANVSAFTNTPMRGYNGLTGTVYVPSALISSYQTATNWSTIYDGGTVTFAAIEGSEWEL